ncbi:MAG: hypothetical protein ABSA85_00760 [Terracidiphilus sp.]|jgi:hypothetical protein
MNQHHNPFCLVVFIAFGGLTLGHAQSSGCEEAPLTTVTRWGGNEAVMIDLRDKPVRKVRGTTVFPGNETVGTLVQVFLRKPSDGRYKTRYEDARLPVAACVTGHDGAFAFSLPPGEYELRMSLGAGVDVTSVFVTVKRGWQMSRRIKAEMHLGM